MGNICDKCDDECTECIVNKLRCLKCAYPKFLIYNGTSCIAICRQNKINTFGYVDSADTTIRECRLCYERCNTCSGGAYNECESCI